MVPQSNLGKIASLIFMIVGIPYFALMTTFISANINLMFNKLRNAVRGFLTVTRRFETGVSNRAAGSGIGL